MEGVGPLGKILSFFDGSGVLERFPIISTKAKEEFEKRFAGGKTLVLAGQKSPKRIVDEIERFRDPYVVFLGSSILDILCYMGIILDLRGRKLPDNQVVFCSTCHLIV